MPSLRRLPVVAALLVACLVSPGHAFWDSIVSVDSGTFDKVVSNETLTIVKFDVKNPYGDPMMAWRKFTEKVGSIGQAKLDILPVEVNCHHELWWNDDSYFNMDLAKRFNVSFDYVEANKFRPTILFLRRGALFEKPIRYTEKEIRTEWLLRWLQKHVADTWFEMPGTSLVLDAYARKFLRVGGGGDTDKAHEARDELLDEAVLEVEALKAGRRRTATKRMKRLGLNAPLAVDMNAEDTEDAWEKASWAIREREAERENAEYYLQVMALIQEYGINAALQEKARLQKAFDEAKKRADELGPQKGLPDEPLRRTPKRKGDTVAKATRIREKAFASPKRELHERLEHRLNILATFRSAAAVNAVNEAEVERVKEEKLAAFARRRKILTGKDAPPPTMVRKMKEEKERQQQQQDERRALCDAEGGTGCDDEL